METWPGKAFKRLTTIDFARNHPSTKLIFFTLNGNLCGGAYIPDDTSWDITVDETCSLATLDGETVILPLQTPRVRIPVPNLAPAITQPLRPNQGASTSVARSPETETVANAVIAPRQPLADRSNLLSRFATRLLQYKNMECPVSVLKDCTPRVARYFAAIPTGNVSVIKAPFLRLKFAPEQMVKLYKLRVSGQGRRGLYEYVKKANLAKNGWIAHDRNENWKLINMIMTLNMRRQIIGWLNED